MQVQTAESIVDRAIASWERQAGNTEPRQKLAYSRGCMRALLQQALLAESAADLRQLKNMIRRAAGEEAGAAS